MLSDQPRFEEVASDNIVEREIQPPKPPKRRKKKLSFAVWWALHEAEELKKTAEKFEQQDSSVVTESESSTKPLAEVDHKGDGQTPKSETVDIAEKEQPAKSEEQPPKTMRKKKKIPFDIWLEKHYADLRTSAERTGMDSPVAEKPSSSVLQETIVLAEKKESVKSCSENVKQDTSLPEEGFFKKEICANITPLVTEQDFISKTQETLDLQEGEQPPKTRRKKKKIPFHVWLEKQAPTNVRTSSESSGTEDNSQITKQEKISVLQETPEKEESSKFGAENVNKQDIFLLGEDGNQEGSFKNEICKEEPVILTTELVTENKCITETQKRRKKKKIPFHIWLEKQAPTNVRTSSESSRTEEDSLVTKQEKVSVLQETPKKKESSKSDAENVKQDTFLLGEDGNQEGSFKKICEEEPVILTTEAVTEKKSVTETQNKVSVLAKDGEQQHNSQHSVISTTNQATCTCQAKCNKPEFGSIEFQKYLMRQLDEMFDINRKLSAKVKYQKDLLRKVFSEQRRGRRSAGWGHEWVE